MKNLVLIISSILVLNSCKKKEESNTATPSNTTTGAVTTSTVNYYGMLGVLQTEILGYSTSSYSSLGLVFFDTPPTNASVMSVSAGNVVINGIQLKEDNSNLAGPAYADSTLSISAPPYNLTANGSGTFNPLSFSYTGNYPNLVDTASIPLILNRSSGLNIPLNSVFDTDTLVIIIDDNLSQSVAKKYTVSSNSVTINFTPAELSVLQASTYGGITINMVKNSFVTVNSKDYLISLEKKYFRINLKIN